MFHLLRGQVMRRLRKPLVVMTPKSPAASAELRRRRSTSLANGTFHRVLHDTTADPAKVTRVLMCTGKIYYELAEERARRKDESVAIVRLEKLYPWWRTWWRLDPALRQAPSSLSRTSLPTWARARS